MSRMTQVIPDLLGGVSQKPDAEKAYNEVRRLDNALLSRTDGVRKRPPTEHINVIDPDISDVPSKPFIHTVKRGPNDIYTIAVMNGELFIYDSLTGDQKQVLTPHGMEYLLSVNGFRAATIGDTTVIVNKDVIVRQEETRAQGQPHEALVYVKSASYSNTYKIDFGSGYVVNYTTANVSDENASKTLSTEDVAIGIYGALVTSSFFNLYFTATFYGSAILITRNDGQDFSLQVTDSQAGQGFILIKNEVQKFEDLPNRTRDGMVVKVAGNPVSDKDDYWVKFQLINKLNEAVGGVWREVPAPSSSFGFKRETMPWAIKRMGSMIGTRKVVQDQLAPLLEYRGDREITKGFDSSDPSNVFYLNNHDQTTDEIVLGASDMWFSDGVAYVNFDVDGTTIGPGESFTVTFMKDTGAGYTTNDELIFYDGDRKWNQSLRTEIQDWDPGDKFKIRLQCFDSSGIPSSAVHPKVFVHAGTNPEFPGFKMMYGPHWYVEYPQGIYTDSHTEYLRICFFDPAIDIDQYRILVGTAVSGTWSANVMGDTMRINVSGAAASAPMSGINVIDVSGSAFKIYLESEPDRSPWFGSHPNGARSLIGGFFYVTREVEPSVQVCYIDTTPADGFYTGGGFATDELAGLTIQNKTDGSEGTISSNSDNMIMVLGLSGGIRNTFEPGDIVEVLGNTGEYYLFDRIDWTNRLAGSDESVPGPSIINRTLNEVFFYKNRLGLCSGEIVNLSAAGDLFRFYRRTATDLLDDDPIDITSSHQDVAAFDAAVNWREKLYLFSNAGHQFVLGGEPNLTAKTVFIQHIGSHQCSLDTRPITVGDRLFFIRNTYGYARVMEMVLDQNGMALAFDLTKNVPQYIKGNVIDMAGDQNVGCLFFLTDDMTHNNLFVYNYERDASGQDLLSAWGKWTFTETSSDPTHTKPQIMTIDMVDGYLYMAIVRKGIPVYGGEGVMLERINLTTPTDATNLHWDRQGLANIASPYTMYIELPTLYPRDGNGKNITDGILKLQYLNVDYHKAGLLRVAITNRARPYENNVFSGGSNTQGRLRTSLIGLNTEIIITLSCEHHNGIGFTSLSWDGDYHKSRR
jgi:hypothetical protein